MATCPVLVPPADRTRLTAAVRLLRGSDTLDIIEWQTAPIQHVEPNLPTGGVYRISGTANEGGVTVPWSLVLKAVRSPRSNVSGWDTPSHPRYWRRELLAYGSGLLDRLPPGIGAPRCLGTTVLPGKVGWLWLEELVDGYAGVWPLARYRLAARHLGQFSGASLVDAGQPVEPWLCQGFLRGLLPELNPIVSLLHDVRAWQHPLVRRVLPTAVADRLVRSVREHPRFLAALDALPHCVCHFDACRPNLFACRGADGEDRTLAIDWAFVGFGAIGEEISMLVWPSVLTFEVDLAQATQLEQAVYDGYLEGLAEAGWQGDEWLVQLGYAANALLQWGLLPRALGFAWDERGHAHWEHVFGRPIAEIVERWAAVTVMLLDRLELARRLCAQLHVD